MKILHGSNPNVPWTILRLQPEEGALRDMYGWSIVDNKGVHIADNLPKGLAQRVCCSVNLLACMELEDMMIADALLAASPITDKREEFSLVTELIGKFHTKATSNG